MVAVIVRHRVADYEQWKPVFDEHGEVRRRRGAQGHQIYRLAADPQEVVVINLFKDAAGAEAFAKDPSLPEVMQRAGVISEPEILYCEQAESVDYSVAVG